MIQANRVNLRLALHPILCHPFLAGFRLILREATRPAYPQMLASASSSGANSDAKSATEWSVKNASPPVFAPRSKSDYSQASAWPPCALGSQRIGQIWNTAADDARLDPILEPLAQAPSKSERLKAASNKSPAVTSSRTPPANRSPMSTAKRSRQSPNRRIRSTRRRVASNIAKLPALLARKL